LLYLWLRPATPAAIAPPARAARAEARGPAIPRIALDRLGASPPAAADSETQRDLFAFGAEPTPPPPPPPPVQGASAGTQPPPPPVPTPPPRAPLNV
jgi:hypothetical protein